jgi:hypothetical protein
MTSNNNLHGGAVYSITFKTLDFPFIITIRDIIKYISFVRKILETKITIKSIKNSHTNISDNDANKILKYFNNLYNAVINPNSEKPELLEEIKITLSHMLDAATYTGENLEMNYEFYMIQLNILENMKYYILINRGWNPDEDEFQIDEDIKIKKHKYDTSLAELFFESIGYDPSYILRKYTYQYNNDQELLKSRITKRYIQEQFGGGIITVSLSNNVGIVIDDTVALFKLFNYLLSIDDNELLNNINKKIQNKQPLIDFLRYLLDRITVIRGKDKILRGFVIRMLREIISYKDKEIIYFELADNEHLELSQTFDDFITFMKLNRNISNNYYDNNFNIKKYDNDPHIVKLFLKAINYKVPFISSEKM